MRRVSGWQPQSRARSVVTAAPAAFGGLLGERHMAEFYRPGSLAPRRLGGCLSSPPPSCPSWFILFPTNAGGTPTPQMTRHCPYVLCLYVLAPHDHHPPRAHARSSGRFGSSRAAALSAG